MTEKKKSLAIIIALCVAIVITLGTTIAVLVAYTQSATSSVNIKYTSTDVAVNLSATAYVGNVEHVFTTDGNTAKEDGSNTILALGPTNANGELSQPNSSTSIDLNKDNPKVIFEYVFENLSEDFHVAIAQPTEAGVTPTPATQDNINLSYYYTTQQLNSEGRRTLVGEDIFTLQSVWGVLGGGSKAYIYIIAEVDNLLNSASLEGDFNWVLGRTTEEQVTTYTLNTSEADYIAVQSTGYGTGVEVGKGSDINVYTMAGETLNNIDIIPAKANQTFVGWAESESGEVVISTTPERNNIETAKIAGETLSTTLYPVYKESSLPDGYIVWDEDSSSYAIQSTPLISRFEEDPSLPADPADFYLPDVYDDGIHGVGKVTKIYDADAETMMGLFSMHPTITNLYLGSCLENLGSYNFALNTKLEKVVIPYSIKDLSYNAFSLIGVVSFSADENGLEFVHEPVLELEVPQWVEVVDAGAFLGAGLKKLEVKGVLQYLGNASFAYCTSVEKSTLVLSEYCVYEDEGSSCFERNNSFNSLIVYAGTDMGQLKTILSLESIYYLGTVRHFIDNNGEAPSYEIDLYFNDILFNGTLSAYELQGITSIDSIVARFGPNLKELELPNTITELAESDASVTNYIRKLTIPASLTSINCVFINFNDLEQIIVNSANPVYDSRNNCNAIIRKSDSALIAGCKNTIIPNTVTSIGYYAFANCAGIESIVIPSSVTKIDYLAFAQCTNLTSIDIPSSVTYCGADVFYNCNNLTRINYNGTLDQWDDIYGYHIFSGMTSLVVYATDGTKTLI